MTTAALRTVFMGTPEIAVPALRALASRTQVTTVITQPDRPAGRGQTLTMSAVKRAALELSLPIWQPDTLKGHAHDPRLQQADLFVVMAFGQILRDDVLALPRFGCVNLHGSLLPRWRGASPLQAAIRAGDAQTGISVMRMVRACDAGPVYSRHAIALPPDATLPWLHDTMAALAATALHGFLDAWPAREPEPQDPALVTHCGKLTKSDTNMTATMRVAEAERLIRACTPIPGCWLEASGHTLRIHAASIASTHALPATAPGQLCACGNALYFICADGALMLRVVQSPGGKAMPAADWLRGHALG